MNVRVGFFESMESNVANIFVLIVMNNDVSYIRGELERFVGIDIPEDKVQLIEKMKYKDSVCFDLLHNKKSLKIVVSCAGDESKINRASVEKLGGFLCDSISGEMNNVILKTNVENIVDGALAYLASGLILKSWKFDKYKSEKKPQNIDSISCITKNVKKNKLIFNELESIIDGVFLSRSMSMEPANVMTPEKMLEECQELKKLGIKVTYLDEKEMKKLGMNAFLGVSLGSDQPAYIITLEYKSGKDRDLVAFVGKGVTFDSGGLCIKSDRYMENMHEDMEGAAIVIGLMKTLATREANANVVGVIGITENMISGKAQRPGDVVVSMSRKTIEIKNTDAEGRLVLADCLWYTAEKFNPSTIVDIATLTGAIQIALGHEFAGLFSNSDQLADSLIKAGIEVGEKLWRFPLHESYESDIKSSVADVKNTGCGRGAGSITAAMFLQRFVKQGIKWAHIDIAAVTPDSKDRALSKAGSTGFGVRLLNEYIKHNFG